MNPDKRKNQNSVEFERILFCLPHFKLTVNCSKPFVKKRAICEKGTNVLCCGQDTYQDQKKPPQISCCRCKISCLLVWETELIWPVLPSPLNSQSWPQVPWQFRQSNHGSVGFLFRRTRCVFCGYLGCKCRARAWELTFCWQACSHLKKREMKFHFLSRKKKMSSNCERIFQVRANQRTDYKS